MNRKLITAAVLAAFVGVTGAASAQDRHDDRRDDHRDDNRHSQQDRHDDNRYAQERRNDRQDYHHDDDRGRDRGAGPRHDIRKGGRLPPEYRNRQYVVDDWRGHHLSAPPRGYHWVQTGGDYVLVAITTGIIASLLLSN
jgi:Ni/Co efflux regulator RcnB